jgi:hypothetical protein
MYQGTALAVPKECISNGALAPEILRAGRNPGWLFDKKYDARPASGCDTSRKSYALKFLPLSTCGSSI